MSLRQFLEAIRAKSALENEEAPSAYLQHYYTAHFYADELTGTRWHEYQIADAFNVFYLSTPIVKKKGGAWRDFMAAAVEATVGVRTYTAGRPELSAWAGAVLLQKLLQKKKHGSYEAVAAAAVAEVEEAAAAYAAADLELAAAAGGRGFSHYGISVLEFLSSPDEYRRRVQIVKEFLEERRRLEAELVRRERAAGPIGAAGVELAGIEAVARILPADTALLRVEPRLFALKAISRSLSAYVGAGGRPINIFVDKSGSMADSICGGGECRSKIAVAAGFALAAYSRYGGRVYFFDTELHAAADPVRELLTVQAGGGTRIDAAFEEAARLGGTSVVVTDAIDEPEFRPNGQDIRVVVVGGGRPEWLSRFRHWAVSDLAGFREALLEAAAED